MKYTVVVRPDAGLWLRWSAKLHEKGRLPYWLWAVMATCLMVIVAGITEHLPFGTGLSDGTWGIMIGVACAFVMYPVSLLLMWNARLDLDEAVASSEAVRVHPHIRELWHNELERISLANQKKSGWVWLTTQHYEALAEMANRHRQAPTPQARSLAVSRITEEMRSLGAEFNALCHLLNSAKNDSTTTH